MITAFLVFLAIMYVVNIIGTALLIGKPRQTLSPRLGATVITVNLAVLAGLVATLLER